MLMRIFRMEADRRPVAYVIAPDHVAACRSYIDAARADPARYPQSVEVFPVTRFDYAPTSATPGLLRCSRDHRCRTPRGDRPMDRPDSRAATARVGP